MVPISWGFCKNEMWIRTQYGLASKLFVLYHAPSFSGNVKELVQFLNQWKQFQIMNNISNTVFKNACWIGTKVRIIQKPKKKWKENSGTEVSAQDSLDWGCLPTRGDVELPFRRIQGMRRTGDKLKLIQVTKSNRSPSKGSTKSYKLCVRANEK